MTSRGTTSRLLPPSDFDATSRHARPVATVVAAVAVRAHGAPSGRGTPCPTPGGTLAECRGTSAGGDLSDLLVVRFSFLHPHGPWGPQGASGG